MRIGIIGIGNVWRGFGLGWARAGHEVLFGDWTVFRPPRLTDKPLTGKYRTAMGQNLRGGFLISRADVAHAMLSSLSQLATIRRTVGIAY